MQNLWLTFWKSALWLSNLKFVVQKHNRKNCVIIQIHKYTQLWLYDIHCLAGIPIVHIVLFAFFQFRQDVAFFDANKTGQLVNRLTADIQEFKSSFKLVISQVITQERSGSDDFVTKVFLVLRF